MVLQSIMNTHKIKQKDNIVKIRTGVKASVVIFPILGLTWVLGLMTFNRETLFLRYLFAVFNSAQGLLIFLFHCVFNRQVSMYCSLLFYLELLYVVLFMFVQLSNECVSNVLLYMMTCLLQTSTCGLCR